MSGNSFAFKDYPDIPRVCHDCGKKLQVKDVRDVHELPERFFRCTDCWPPRGPA